MAADAEHNFRVKCLTGYWTLYWWRTWASVALFGVVTYCMVPSPWLWVVAFAFSALQGLMQWLRFRYLVRCPFCSR